jgi:signal transduction histidine kinase
MEHGHGRRTGRGTGRGRLGTTLTIAASIAVVVLSFAFTWLRVALPSEPARISSDDWPWSAQGVEVVPIGDSGTFRDGDVVTGVGGQTLESWAAQLPGRTPLDPLPSPIAFEVLRGGSPQHLEVPLGPQPVGGLVLAGLPLLGYTIVQAVVAVLAWQRRPSEGWRRGFLVGSAANLASALIWEVGLRSTDLVRPEPMLALFLMSAPLHLLFWSSVVHVLVSWPRRWERLAASRRALAALWILPQVALAIGLAVTHAAHPDALEWIGSWDRVLAAVVLAMIALVLAALARAYLRTPAGRDSWLRIVMAACLAGALAVGLLTVLPILLIGHPLFSRSAVAALGLPLAVVLVVGTLRSRLFEVDVLLASRRRLVVAREEERRRIRRDLHDGIGPMLAAMTLKVDLARDVLRTDPDAADRALCGLKNDTQAAVSEIRRLTRELRPPALDELGVVEAIRHRADELSGGTEDERVDIQVVAATLPPLDAAAEAAAYRIAVEAMTNVVRHAHAHRCRVRLSANGMLVLEVSDDGAGFADGRGAGVGMTSMRERCAELGGSLAVERTADGWTVVRAALPISG